MRRVLLSIICGVVVMVASATELVRFDLLNFDTWTYTRPGVTLTSQYIGANNVNLFKSSSGVDFTLISPVFNRGAIPSIAVNVYGYSRGHNDSRYSPTKGSPTIDVLDEQGTVLKSVYYHFDQPALERKFTVSIDMRDVDVSRIKVRIACWEADTYCALSVKELVVDNNPADVNGDGVVNAADVTALYNWILNNDASSLKNGDANEDGTVNAGDVTAVYNRILGM